MGEVIEFTPRPVDVDAEDVLAVLIVAAQSLSASFRETERRLRGPGGILEPRISLVPESEADNAS